MKKQIIELPLHKGNAPRYLFEKQKKILYEIGRLIINNFGTEEFLKRISDPIYFQVLGCISGFDWHSSGVTTTVCHALKEVFNKNPEYNIFIFGGKGKYGLETPEEIKRCKNIKNNDYYIFLSRLTSRIDNNCIQDGYSLYHHTIFIDGKGNWAVIQQGMNKENRYARRYHWFNKITNSQNETFIIQPHTGIITTKKEKRVLNLVDKKSESLQNSITKLITTENPEKLIRELDKIINKSNMFSLFEFKKYQRLPPHHHVNFQFDNKKLYKNFCNIKDNEIKNFIDIVLTEGVGLKTLRALCLISEVVFGNEISWRDPAKFSFAFGGKDGHPYPLDINSYDKTIEILKDIVDKSKIDGKDKLEIFRKLQYLIK